MFTKPSNPLDIIIIIMYNYNSIRSSAFYLGGGLSLTPVSKRPPQKEGANMTLKDIAAIYRRIAAVMEAVAALLSLLSSIKKKSERKSE